LIVVAVRMVDTKVHPGAVRVPGGLAGAYHRVGGARAAVFQSSALEPPILRLKRCTGRGLRAM